MIDDKMNAKMDIDAEKGPKNVAEGPMEHTSKDVLEKNQNKEVNSTNNKNNDSSGTNTKNTEKSCCN